MQTLQKTQKIAISAAVIGIIIVGAAGVYFVPAQSTLTMIPITPEEQAKNDALGVAQKYIVTSPTFAFDGLHNTLDTEDISVMESDPIQYKIRIAFDSANVGFGDRTGQMLAQVITHHKMDIIVSEGNVISAVTDETWDELNHQYVLKKPQSKLPSHDKPVSSFEGAVTDYTLLIAAIESRGILVQHKENLSAESSTFSVPIRVISVGGADVQVFEFKDEAKAEASSLTVSEDGTEIGTSIIRWMDTPHFYTKGKIIVLYVGQNPEITNLLESLLGNQFAGM
ncbi:MAG TPA: hypothetical protein VLF17_04750 [Candidatus Nitrosotenuis sp.]|nr:hypothetical protein [Candidatus Nitrosotenuis sp.]